MPVDFDAITGNLNRRDLTDAFVPHRLAQQISPRIVFPHQVDPDVRPEQMRHRAAGRAYVTVGRVAATVLVLPLAVAALAATAIFTAAAILVTAAALAIGIGGALAGGIIGAVGWATRRHTSPRRGAVAGMELVSGGVGLPAILGIRGAAAFTGRAIGFGRRLAIAGGQGIGMLAAGATSVSVGAAVAVGTHSARVVRSLNKSTAPSAPDVAGDDVTTAPVAVDGPAPVLTTPAVETPAVAGVAPVGATGAAASRRIAVASRRRVITQRAIAMPETITVTASRASRPVEIDL